MEKSKKKTVYDPIVATIIMQLYFDEERINEVKVLNEKEMCEQIETWRKLYNLRRWAHRCNINVTFLVKAQTAQSPFAYPKSLAGTNSE